MSDRKEHIQMVDRKERGNRANSARRGNTRYGDVEDSMIQFDLTSSKIIENDHEEKKKQQYMEDTKQQRKSLKLYIHEQI
jgi:hypothetical protein